MFVAAVPGPDSSYLPRMPGGSGVSIIQRNMSEDAFQPEQNWTHLFLSVFCHEPCRQA